MQLNTPDICHQERNKKVFYLTVHWILDNYRQFFTDYVNSRPQYDQVSTIPCADFLKVRAYFITTGPDFTLQNFYSLLFTGYVAMMNERF